MKHLSITVKIWLSIGIFVLGSIVTTALGQFQGRDEERSLRRTSDALFPAVQKTQQAEAAFYRAIRGFNQAVILQSAPDLEQAVEEGRATGKYSECGGRDRRVIPSALEPDQTTGGACPGIPEGRRRDIRRSSRKSYGRHTGDAGAHACLG